MKTLFYVMIYIALVSVVLLMLLSGNVKRGPNIVSQTKSKSAVVPPTTTELYNNTTDTVLKERKPRCIAGSIPLRLPFQIYNSSSLPNVTVVVAYFDLGAFLKGPVIFDTSLYSRWMHVYKYLRNPLVFYTDSKEIVDLMKTIRNETENITKIILVKRSSLWAFTYVEQIRTLYSNPQYPKHHPNTVIPEYSCAQHAKYAVVEDAIKKNHFHTTYFTWLDVGYFRYILNRHKNFVITKPPRFNESMVAMNWVYQATMNTTAREIVFLNKVWVGGGMFFGTVDTLPTFIEDYRRAVEHYLHLNLSSTDQQVLYSMNTYPERKVVTQRIPIQKYKADVTGDCWFYLGYACYRELSWKM